MKERAIAIGWWVLSAIVLAIAFWVRFHDLDRASVRSDEINFLNCVLRGTSVTELWIRPPWMNQIPFADSIAILWHKVRPATPNERTVREPFALIGWLTVAGCILWLFLRVGPGPATILGVWMAVSPYHVYQSREAYYYVVVMAFSAGLTLHTVDLLSRLRQSKKLKGISYACWTLWSVSTCLTHMSTWAVWFVLWVSLLLVGWLNLPHESRRRHGVALVASAIINGVFLIPWVLRAIQEVHKVSKAEGHIGASFSWVAPRVLPMFAAGANALGVSLCALIALLAAMRWLNAYRGRVPPQPIYHSLTIVTILGFLTAFLYVGLVGAGVAKIAYFSMLLPIFLTWASMTLDSVWYTLPHRWALRGRLVTVLAFVVLLWTPARAVMQLDGKPVPYKLLRQWLDQNLEAGSVVIVDRWLEPWNEMALYAPTNVYITFTVPDEPYENYMRLSWREVTRKVFESGVANAFIRLTRNHEDRAGLWTWPETFFRRRAVVVNDAGLWLRKHGYAAIEDFYAFNTNRLVAEIFFDTQSDILERARSAGKTTAIFYRHGLPYEKSGPLGVFRFRTQQFMDWRVLGQTGSFDVFNLTNEPIDAVIEVSAISPFGAKTVGLEKGPRIAFPAGQFLTASLGTLNLQPGLNRLTLRDIGQTGSPLPLYIAEIRAKRIERSQITPSPAS